MKMLIMSGQAQKISAIELILEYYDIFLNYKHFLYFSNFLQFS